jgi:hypothetical protein
MINKKIKKTVLSIVLATSMSMPSMVSATYPTIDYSNLLETITQNYQDMQNWAQQKMIMMAEMDLQAALSSLGIDSQNNAMLNMISRDGKRAQTLQNIEVMEWSVADSDACGTIATQILGKKSESDSKEKREDEKEKAADKNGNFESSIKDWKVAVEKIVDDTIDFCEATVDSSGKELPSMDKSLCLQGGLLTGGNGLTLSKKDSAAALKIVDILVGATPTYKKSERMIDGSKEKRILQLKEIKVEALRNLARNSLLEVTSMFISDGEIYSPFENLSNFDTARHGNADWLADIANVSVERKNSTYISEITRKMAVMNAFLVHMELKKYKQQLRVEGLHAAMLALQIEG